MYFLINEWEDLGYYIRQAASLPTSTIFEATE